MDVSQYLEIFLDETKEHLQTLNESLLILEKEPENKDTINEIFRAAHSLKGMAGTMGYKRMQKLTHDMENVFQGIRNDKMKVSAKLVDVLFQCLDALEEYLEMIQNTADEGTNENEAIIKQLTEILNEESDTEKTKTSVDNKEETSNENEKKFLDIVFTEKEKKRAQDIMASGQKLYGVTVFIQDTCLLKAARAFIVFKAVEEYGSIIKFEPGAQEIEDENFDLDFSFVLVSEEPLEKIKATINDVSEIDKIFCEEMTEIKEEAEDVILAQEIVEENNNSVSNNTNNVIKGTNEKSNVNQPVKQNVNKPVVNRTVRVDIEKLDALMNQVSELIIAKNSLVSISSAESTGLQEQGFHEQIEYLERITTNLHESVMKVRMVPIESVVNRFPRMIRDLSKKLDKKMELYMTGEDTELDRTVIDEIGDPLQHLLRNSADHGLESKAIRKERGKPEQGSIFLDAYQEGNNVIIEVSDDGNGIDVESIKKKGIDRGIITPEQAETMENREIIDLLFLPSFSMAQKITDVSGRGVGLDVVKSKIAALGGDVEVKSKLGEGSKFTIRLPLTLAIIQALMVEVREEKYAIALGSIQTIEDILVQDIKYVQAKEVIHIRGTVIPVIRLDKILDIEPREQEPESLTVVIVQKGDKQAGLVVDNLIGQQEIVIKSLGKYIENNRIISGATILGDGEVALIVDVNSLI
ncbi:chemotaxis protein CheA [Anaerosacchariphilus polymeriproducens]|uniref:Chemotaxis protein CheA n=1 Tax=Anaerosacchariphilus polymeriproducens TaxID=1812858 RepID=A0A371AS60_9FIRM|nr:chemotaxis protein CheA [Anaerosacchariphilus polymeriproducens]RDU22411.1 chemotaxis protein CheA [Anaerosacchariphilus polymeriproducens]